MTLPRWVRAALVAALPAAGVPAPAFAQYQVPASPPITQTPLAPIAPGTATPPTQPPPTQPPGPGPDIWLSRTVADVQALDKISARVQTLPVKVGQAVTFGSLTVTLRACMVRPPDQPQDSAALLEITDSHPEQPGFHGWMFASEPEVSMLESAVYDIRLNSCHS